MMLHYLLWSNRYTRCHSGGGGGITCNPKNVEKNIVKISPESFFPTRYLVTRALKSINNEENELFTVNTVIRY